MQISTIRNIAIVELTYNFYVNLFGVVLTSTHNKTFMIHFALANHPLRHNVFCVILTYPLHVSTFFLTLASLQPPDPTIYFINAPLSLVIDVLKSAHQ